MKLNNNYVYQIRNIMKYKMKIQIIIIYNIKMKRNKKEHLMLLKKVYKF